MGCASLRSAVDKSWETERQWRQDIADREAASAKIATAIREKVLDECKISGFEDNNSFNDFRGFLEETVVFDYLIGGSSDGIRCATDCVKEAVASVAPEEFQCKGRVLGNHSLDNDRYYRGNPPSILRVECGLPENPSNIL